MGFDDEGETIILRCHSCFQFGLQEFNGLYFCPKCYAQDEGLIDTNAADDEDYNKVDKRRPTPGRLPIVKKYSLYWLLTLEHEDAAAANNNYDNSSDNSSIKREPDNYDGSYNDDGLGPVEPEDFGSAAVKKMGYEDYYNEVRIRYVMGCSG